MSDITNLPQSKYSRIGVGTSSHEGAFIPPIPEIYPSMSDQVNGGTSRQYRSRRVKVIKQLALNLIHDFNSAVNAAADYPGDGVNNSPSLENDILNEHPDMATSAAVAGGYSCSSIEDNCTTLCEQDSNYCAPPTQYSSYHDIGDPTCVCVCNWCGAKFWQFEALLKERINGLPISSLCCGKGKVQLPFVKDPPKELHELFFGSGVESQEFLESIRSYNTCFAFTSMGGKIDRSVTCGRGRFSFRLSGQNHHLMGSLIPEEGQIPKFAQLYIYIYDTSHESENRVANFSLNGRSNILNEAIVDKIKCVLDVHNVLVQSYRMVRDRVESGEIEDFKLRLVRNRVSDGRTYNLPSCDEVAGLIVGDVDSVECNRDIIVERQSGKLKRIDELHPLYLPLQYPILFPYGEDGFREDVSHSDVSISTTKKKNRLTMREYFAYRLQERDFEISTLLYARRLLQQYIVDGYTMIESSRLKYVRKNQTKLRADCYKCVADAVSCGVSLGGNIGKRIILPSSFSGGPRYMIQHYQAICRWAGYPHIFITFTCIPKWPENNIDQIFSDIMH